MAEIAVDIADTQENDLGTQENESESEDHVSETLIETPENMETVLETVLENEELIEEPIKKKPGRPTGSRNKGPSKPRPKRKVAISKAIEYESRDEEPSAPAQPERIWDAQHQPIPTEAKTEMAELMLKLLRGQAIERNQRRDAQRRSWFA
jgi:hypothetical protein